MEPRPAQRGWDESLFASLISHTFSASQQCFSLTINQPTVISVMTFQINEQTGLYGSAGSSTRAQDRTKEAMARCCRQSDEEPDGVDSMACKQPDEGRTKEPVVSQYGQSYEDGTKDVAAREPL